MLPPLLLHESHEKIKTLHWVRRTGVQKETKIFTCEEALPLEASPFAAGCTERHFEHAGTPGWRGGAWTRQRSDSAQCERETSYMEGNDISSVFRAMAFCGVTLIMGLFFFLGSSGGMSYFVSTSSSIECHPVDSKGMAGSNTLTQTLDRLLVDPHLLLSISTGFFSTLTCQHFINVGCKPNASFTNLSQSEISQVRCGLVTWKCGATI